MVLEGARFSDNTRRRALQEAGFGHLKNLTLKRSRSYCAIDLETLLLLSTLSIPRLGSLCYNADSNTGSNFVTISEIKWLSATQCTVAFGQLRSLHIIDEKSADELLKWIGPYCARLKVFTLDTNLTLFAKSLPLIPATIESLNIRVVPTEWMRVAQVADWMKCILEIISSRYFSELKSLSLSLSGKLLKPRERDEYHQREEHSLLEQLQGFGESMKCLCESAGIACSLNLQLQCSCTDHLLP